MKNSSFMEIKYNLTIGELGLYATKDYPIESIVFTLNGEIFDHPTRESIHIGNNQHIYDENGIYMNHSFDPTTRINGTQVVAIKNIKCGDELTFNYNETEINMAHPFEINGVRVCGKCGKCEKN